MIELKNTDPDKTLAFVVGIEQYDLKLKALDGPTRDAVRFIKWLTGLGVPWKNISAFLSPLESNREYCRQELNLIAGKESSGERDFWEVPARDTIVKALTESLPLKRAECMFFFWGGHGVMTGDKERYLIFKNATEHDKAAIGVDEIIRTLHEKRDQMAYPRRQLFFIDSCANYFEDLSQSLSLASLSSKKSSPDAEIHQYAMHAASPGQRAVNDHIRHTGAFSDSVLTALEKQSGKWPDIEKLKSDVIARFDGDKKQCPVFFQWRDWQGNEGRNGNFDLLFRRAQLIREAREQLENSRERTPLDALAKIYLELIHRRSLRGGAEAKISYDGILGELSEYLDQEQGVALPPIYEFLYRVGKSLDEGICEWMRREKASLKPLIDKLDEDMETESKLAAEQYRYLVLDFSIDGSRSGKYPPAIEYWIYEEHGNGYRLCPSVDARGTRLQTGTLGKAKEAFREILAHVEKIPGPHLLFIEILAPMHRLEHDFDQWPMQRKGYLIGVSHPLTLRLAERHSGKALELVQPYRGVSKRFSGGDRAGKIEWFPDDKKSCRYQQQIEAYVREKLVEIAGLETIGAKEKQIDFLQAVLWGGAPFICWFREVPRDITVFKETLEKLVLGKPLNEIPRVIKDHRAEAMGSADLPGASLSLLWDDPDRDPIRVKLESPESSGEKS